MDLGLRNRVAVIAASCRGMRRATAHCFAQEDTMAQVKERAEAAVPLDRYGKPEEVANLIIFLSSAAAVYSTGATVLADGGLVRGLM